MYHYSKTTGKKYSNKGGVVQYVGKPYKAVYDACFELIAEPNLRKLSDSSVDVSQKDLDKRRICMIGDSLDHDIIGTFYYLCGYFSLLMPYWL
jgi:ribonucleotide monophosphatase NagD (HAD superfamily)